MAVPKQRHTKSRRNKRRLHIFSRTPVLTRCPKCGKPVFPHTICQNCGYYKGREIIDVISKLEKKERKKRKKEIKAKEREEKAKKTTTHPPPSPKRAPKSLSWKEMSRK
ncbi:50S ribosomal protein L32 [Patescibacteria group bacterium]|nr:50S ribosomal protein L32 [Patescibacteria group bacterium]